MDHARATRENIVAWKKSGRRVRFTRWDGSIGNSRYRLLVLLSMVLLPAKDIAFDRDEKEKGRRGEKKGKSN